MDYSGKCAHLHGHNGRVEVEAVRNAGGLNAQGFVVDFSDVKAFVKTWIDTNWDHRMLLRNDDPVLHYLAKADPGHIVVLPHNPTAEYLANDLFRAVNGAALNEGDGRWSVRSVRFWETPTSYAVVRHRG